MGHRGTSPTVSLAGISWALLGLRGPRWRRSRAPQLHRPGKTLDAGGAAIETALLKVLLLGCDALNSAGLAWQPAEQHCRWPQKAADMLIILMIIQTDFKV